jgi:sterol desaturase/sphingolipid hydroxylase (fatty acid hydroxylase superfamily)
MVTDRNRSGRDLVSDKSRNKLGSSILLYMILRTAAPFIMAYDRNVLPTFSLYSPFKIMAWQISLDFFFYCYHRACHEVRG